MRLAIGSSRWDVARHTLAEGVLLSLVGGALALGFAVVTTRGLTAFAGQHVPRVELVGVDLPVIGFSFLVALATGLLFALAPALAASATNPRELLAGGGRGSTASATRLRDALVVGEIATSVVLVIASGLLLSSFRNLMSVDMGFDPTDVQVAQTYLPVQIDPNEGQWRSFPNRVEFYSEVIRLLEEEASVSAAAGISQLPLRETNGIRFVVEGEEVEVTARSNAEYRVTSERYFEVMGVPLVRGRSFTSMDDMQGTNVLIVNRAWVRQHADERDPLALRVRLGNGDEGPLWQIVGVVGDVREQSLDVAARPTLYAPYRQAAGHNMTFVFRSTDTSGAALEASRDIIRRVDRDQPAFGLASMDDVVAASVAERTLLMQLVSIFGVLALLLAGLGIFGVVSFSTRQRVRELGIRLALGARPTAIFGLVLRRGILLGAGGVALGLLGAGAATTALTSMLFEVGRFDPAVVVGVVASTFAVVAVGSFHPARWASSVDPLDVLRADDPG